MEPEMRYGDRDRTSTVGQAPAARPSMSRQSARSRLSQQIMREDKITLYFPYACQTFKSRGRRDPPAEVAIRGGIAELTRLGGPVGRAVAALPAEVLPHGLAVRRRRGAAAGGMWGTISRGGRHLSDCQWATEVWRIQVVTSQPL